MVDLQMLNMPKPSQRIDYLAYEIRNCYKSDSEAKPGVFAKRIALLRCMGSLKMGSHFLYDAANQAILTYAPFQLLEGSK